MSSPKTSSKSDDPPATATADSTGSATSTSNTATFLVSLLDEPGYALNFNGYPVNQDLIVELSLSKGSYTTKFLPEIRSQVDKHLLREMTQITGHRTTSAAPWKIKSLVYIMMGNQGPSAARAVRINITSDNYDKCLKMILQRGSIDFLEAIIGP